MVSAAELRAGMKRQLAKSTIKNRWKQSVQTALGFGVKNGRSGGLISGLNWFGG